MINNLLNIKKLSLLKVLFFFIFAILIFFSFQTLSVHASAGRDMTRQLSGAAGTQGAGFGDASDPRLIVSLVIKVFLSLLGILLTTYMVYAGYLVMFSAGDEEKINKGKSTLKYSIIGLFVVLSGYGLFVFVSDVIMEASIDRSGANYYSDTGFSIDEYNSCLNGGGDRVSCQAPQ